jgi:hypothetical protein
VLHTALGEIRVEKQELRLSIFVVKQRSEDTVEKKMNLGINGRGTPGIELKGWGVEQLEL